MVGYEQHRTIFRDVGERTGIPIKCDIGQLKGFSEEHLRIDILGFKRLVMPFHFITTQKTLKDAHKGTCKRAVLG